MPKTEKTNIHNSAAVTEALAYRFGCDTNFPIRPGPQIVTLYMLILTAAVNPNDVERLVRQLPARCQATFITLKWLKEVAYHDLWKGKNRGGIRMSNEAFKSIWRLAVLVEPYEPFVLWNDYSSALTGVEIPRYAKKLPSALYVMNQGEIDPWYRTLLHVVARGKSYFMGVSLRVGFPSTNARSPLSQQKPTLRLLMRVENVRDGSAVPNSVVIDSLVHGLKAHSWIKVMGGIDYQPYNNGAHFFMKELSLGEIEQLDQFTYCWPPETGQRFWCPPENSAPFWRWVAQTLKDNLGVDVVRCSTWAVTHDDRLA